MDFSRLLLDIKTQHLYRQVRGAREGGVDFCSNDYLGLKNHPQVIEAFKRGADEFGVGAGASHFIRGHTRAHQALEEALADWTGCEKAVLFSTGYMANLGVFSALKGELDWVLQDRLNHASLIDANHLIGLPLQRYLHNNMASLGKKVGKQQGQGLIVTDNVFSMDGDRADIGGIAAVAGGTGALVMQDDAHGFGVFEAVIPRGSIYMATLGKAVGAMGAFVAGDEDLIDFLMQKSRPYIYTTAIAPALCVATLKSLALIRRGGRRDRLVGNIAFFREMAEGIGVPVVVSDSAIQPLIIGDNARTLKISRTLFERGFQVGAIRSPTVAKGTERLRITLNANHTKQQIEQLLTHIKYALQ